MTNNPMYQTNHDELIKELQKVPGFEGISDTAIVDLTATNNTHKEAAMATNEENKTENKGVTMIEVNGKRYPSWTIDGEVCVDGHAALDIIGLGYANQLNAYVQKGKVKMVGEVPAKGKVNKNVYTLESVVASIEKYHPRGDDAPEQFMFEQYPDVLERATKQLLDLLYNKEGNNELRALLVSLQHAENLTAKRRQYNKMKKGTGTTKA